MDYFLNLAKEEISHLNPPAWRVSQSGTPDNLSFVATVTVRHPVGDTQDVTVSAQELLLLIDLVKVLHAKLFELGVRGTKQYAMTEDGTHFWHYDLLIQNWVLEKVV